MATWINPLEILHSDTYVEHVCVKVKAAEFAVNISVTYRPPGQSQQHDAEMYRVLRKTLLNSESVILGDFDLPHINWR